MPDIETVIKLPDQCGMAAGMGSGDVDRPGPDGVYLGVVGHRTVLESIRVTVQATQEALLARRSVYPLPTHSCQI